MRSIILILVLPIVGCTSTPNNTIDEIAPEHLLHTGESWASKSITIKDYFPPEEVN